MIRVVRFIRICLSLNHLCIRLSHVVVIIGNGVLIYLAFISVSLYEMLIIVPLFVHAKLFEFVINSSPLHFERVVKTRSFVESIRRNEQV